MQTTDKQQVETDQVGATQVDASKSRLGVRYSETEKQEILAYARAHSDSAASKKFGVAMGTIQRWKLVRGANGVDRVHAPTAPVSHLNAPRTQESVLADLRRNEAERRALSDELAKIALHANA